MLLRLSRQRLWSPLRVPAKLERNAPKTIKGTSRPLYLEPKPDKRRALGGRLGDAVAPFARSRRIGRVLSIALVARGGRNRGNADLPVAAGQHRAFAVDL